jgi:hypothetical protein
MDIQLRLLRYCLAASVIGIAHSGYYNSSTERKEGNENREQAFA